MFELAKQAASAFYRSVRTYTYIVAVEAKVVPILMIRDGYGIISG